MEGGTDSETEVVVRTLTHGTHCLAIPRTARIAMIKDALFQITDTPEDQQRLLYRGREITDNNATIESLNLPEGVVLHMVSRPAPAPQPSSTIPTAPDQGPQIFNLSQFGGPDAPQATVLGPFSMTIGSDNQPGGNEDYVQHINQAIQQALSSAGLPFGSLPGPSVDHGEDSDPSLRLLPASPPVLDPNGRYTAFSTIEALHRMILRLENTNMEQDEMPALRSSPADELRNGPHTAAWAHAVRAFLQASRPVLENARLNRETLTAINTVYEAAGYESLSLGAVRSHPLYTTTTTGPRDTNNTSNTTNNTGHRRHHTNRGHGEIPPHDSDDENTEGPDSFDEDEEEEYSSDGGYAEPWHDAEFVDRMQEFAQRIVRGPLREQQGRTPSNPQASAGTGTGGTGTGGTGTGGTGTGGSRSQETWLTSVENEDLILVAAVTIGELARRFFDVLGLTQAPTGVNALMLRTADRLRSLSSFERGRSDVLRQVRLLAGHLYRLASIAGELGRDLMYMLSALNDDNMFLFQMAPGYIEILGGTTYPAISLWRTGSSMPTIQAVGVTMSGMGRPPTGAFHIPVPIPNTGGTNTGGTRTNTGGTNTGGTTTNTGGTAPNAGGLPAALAGLASQITSRVMGNAPVSGGHVIVNTGTSNTGGATGDIPMPDIASIFQAISEGRNPGQPTPPSAPAPPPPGATASPPAPLPPTTTQSLMSDFVRFMTASLENIDISAIARNVLASVDQALTQNATSNRDELGAAIMQAVQDSLQAQIGDTGRIQSIARDLQARLSERSTSGRRATNGPGGGGASTTTATATAATTTTADATSSATAPTPPTSASAPTPAPATATTAPAAAPQQRSTTPAGLGRSGLQPRQRNRTTARTPTTTTATNSAPPPSTVPTEQQQPGMTSRGSTGGDGIASLMQQMFSGGADTNAGGGFNISSLVTAAAPALNQMMSASSASQQQRSSSSFGRAPSTRQNTSGTAAIDVDSVLGMELSSEDALRWKGVIDSDDIQQALDGVDVNEGGRNGDGEVFSDAYVAALPQKTTGGLLGNLLGGDE